MHRLESDQKRRQIKQNENQRIKRQKEIEEARLLREQINAKHSSKDATRVVSKLMTDAQRRKEEKEKRMREKEQMEIKKVCHSVNLISLHNTD